MSSQNYCCSGIVYAHRNEDIVNNKPGTQDTTEASILDDSSGQPQVPPLKKKRKVDVLNSKNIVSSSKDWKRTQYKLLAQYMDMGVIEFSKWVLSSTSLEIENVLQDYKKREKMPNG